MKKGEKRITCPRCKGKRFYRPGRACGMCERRGWVAVKPDEPQGAVPPPMTHEPRGIPSLAPPNGEGRATKPTVIDRGLGDRIEERLHPDVVHQKREGLNAQDLAYIRGDATPDLGDTIRPVIQMGGLKINMAAVGYHGTGTAAWFMAGRAWVWVFGARYRVLVLINGQDVEIMSVDPREGTNEPFNWLTSRGLAVDLARDLLVRALGYDPGMGSPAGVEPEDVEVGAG